MVVTCRAQRRCSKAAIEKCTAPPLAGKLRFNHDNDGSDDRLPGATCKINYRNPRAPISVRVQVLPCPRGFPPCLVAPSRPCPGESSPSHVLG